MDYPQINQIEEGTLDQLQNNSKKEKEKKAIQQQCFLRKVLIICILQNTCAFLSCIFKISFLKDDLKLTMSQYSSIITIPLYIFLSIPCLHYIIKFPFNYIILIIITLFQLCFNQFFIQSSMFAIIHFICYGITLVYYIITFIYSLFIRTKFIIWVPLLIYAFLSLISTLILDYFDSLLFALFGLGYGLLYVLYCRFILITSKRESNSDYVLSAINLFIDSPGHVVYIIFMNPKNFMYVKGIIMFVRIFVNIIRCLSIKAMRFDELVIKRDDMVCCLNNKEITEWICAPCKF